MADQVSALYNRDTEGDYVTVHSVVGESGQGIHVIDKTANATADLGHAYAATLFEVAALKRLSASAHKTYGVAAIILTHGETDGRNEDYETDLLRLYADYNTDITDITGQETSIPLFLSQQQTCPKDNSFPASMIAQWRIGLTHPGEIVCVGPKYQYPYAKDGIHLVAAGYDQLGEKYAEVYYETVVLGRVWHPLEPTAVTRSGSRIVVDFHVPVPPLAWDESLPAPHQAAHTAWSKGRGFEVEDRSGELDIAAVEIRGGSILIALAREPTASDLAVRYAFTQDGDGLFGGQASGRIGQLRDSDPLVGYATGKHQYNYAVSFSMTVK
jgi:hypothetical protein